MLSHAEEIKLLAENAVLRRHILGNVLGFHLPVAEVTASTIEAFQTADTTSQHSEGDKDLTHETSEEEEEYNPDYTSDIFRPLSSQTILQPLELFSHPSLDDFSLFEEDSEDTYLDTPTRPKVILNDHYTNPDDPFGPLSPAAGPVALFSHPFLDETSNNSDSDEPDTPSLGRARIPAAPWSGDNIQLLLDLSPGLNCADSSWATGVEEEPSSDSCTVSREFWHLTSDDLECLHRAFTE